MKKLSFLLMTWIILTGTFSATAQSGDLNNYKYVVIPVQFNFQSSENQYLLNTKLKHLLNQHGFTTYMDVEEFPEDLAFNGCTALYADLKSSSEGFMAFKTELTLRLVNCRKEVVFETKKGESRAKDYQEGYYEALDDAFTSFEGVHYQYNNSVIQQPALPVATSPAPSAAQKAEEQSTVQEISYAPPAQPAAAPKTGLEATLDKVYEFEGNKYGIRKIEAGYLMLNEKTGDRIALLNEAGDAGILYNSDQINGTATIKDNGNQIKVVYFDQGDAAVKELIYQAR